MRRLWIAFVAVVLVSFGVLGWVGSRIYQQAQPIPEHPVDPLGVGQRRRPVGATSGGREDHVHYAAILLRGSAREEPARLQLRHHAVARRRGEEEGGGQRSHAQGNICCGELMHDVVLLKRQITTTSELRVEESGGAAVMAEQQFPEDQLVVQSGGALSVGHDPHIISERK